MPLYEVRFFLRYPEELSAPQQTNLSHTVYERMVRNMRGPVPKPEGRKVYINRHWEEPEKRRIVKEHALSDTARGFDWNTNGCTCEVCKEYRDAGAVISGGEVHPHG